MKMKQKNLTQLIKGGNINYYLENVIGDAHKATHVLAGHPFKGHLSHGGTLGRVALCARW